MKKRWKDLWLIGGIMFLLVSNSDVQGAIFLALLLNYSVLVDIWRGGLTR